MASCECGAEEQTADHILFYFFLFYSVAYLSSYHEKAINALHELA